MRVLRRVSFLMATVCLSSCGAGGDDGDDLITVETGAIPVLLSAPHGGEELLEGVPPRSSGTTVRDAETYELTLMIRDLLTEELGARPHLVAASVSRTQIDLNRAAEDAYEHPDAAPVYEAYHRALRSAVDAIAAEAAGCALLVDVHGQSYGAGAVYRGTRNGRTADLDALFEEGAFLWALSDSGLDMTPEGPTGSENLFFNGGYIVGAYGREVEGGVDAVQLEIGSRHRRPETLEATASSIASSIASHVRTACDGAALTP